MAHKATGVKEITCWDDLAALTEYYSTGEWVFRGVSQESYDLRPKVGRSNARFDRHLNERPFSVAEELEYLSRFKKRSRPFVSSPLEHDVEWLALAQHHGMATRLLDWTDSIFVAAYFAMSNLGLRGKAAIYAIPLLPAFDEGGNTFDIADPYSYRPPHLSPRIAAQHASFTIHPNPMEPLSPSGMKKWPVRTDCCLDIIRLLDSNGVNHASLFPGLDGVAEHVGWQYRFNR